MEGKPQNFPYLRMTRLVFFRDKESYTSLSAILESFGSCSGLRVNHEKTEILVLGSNFPPEKDLNDHKICETIKNWAFILVMTKNREMISITDKH